MSTVFMSAIGNSDVLHAYLVDQPDQVLCGLLKVVEPDDWYVDEDSVPPPRSADATGKRWYSMGRSGRYLAMERCGRCAVERDRIAYERIRIHQVGSGQVGFGLAQVISLHSRQTA